VAKGDRGCERRCKLIEWSSARAVSKYDEEEENGTSKKKGVK
jgi:hypothetical protein